METCDICGKQYKNLGAHKRAAHGISKNDKRIADRVKVVSDDHEVEPVSSKSVKPKYKNVDLPKWLPKLLPLPDHPDRKAELIELDAKGMFLTDNFELATKMTVEFNCPPIVMMGEERRGEPRIYGFKMTPEEAERQNEL
jgi:hypothetical protein